MLGFGLNQVTASDVPFGAFLELAAQLGCAGVEMRNDLGRPLFDGESPAAAGARIRAAGLRLLGLSQVYPFNVWSQDIADEIARLIEVAVVAGTETISLIPCNDGRLTAPKERRAHLRNALRRTLPLLEQADMVALVEPLGFARSSLRLKSELVAEIDALGGAGRFRLVHDTFHHALAGGGMMYPGHTGIVHVSGVDDPALSLDQMEDEHRGLVGAQDRLDSVGQIAALRRSGYSGVISFECFAPGVRALPDPAPEIAASIEFISSRLQALAA